MNFKQFTDKTLKDIEVKATEMFDRNFEEQGFFGTKWKERKTGSDGRAVLMGVGRLRRGVKTSKRSGDTITWYFDVPYAKIHNEGGTIKGTQNIRSFSRTRKGKTHIVKSHTRKVNTTMPQRQFVGDHPKLRAAIEIIVERNATKLIESLKNNIKK